MNVSSSWVSSSCSLRLHRMTHFMLHTYLLLSCESRNFLSSTFYNQLDIWQREQRKFVTREREKVSNGSVIWIKDGIKVKSCTGKIVKNRKVCKRGNEKGDEEWRLKMIICHRESINHKKLTKDKKLFLFLTKRTKRVNSFWSRRWSLIKILNQEREWTGIEKVNIQMNKRFPWRKESICYHG